jgi:hypothetical protein
MEVVGHDLALNHGTDWYQPPCHFLHHRGAAERGGICVTIRHVSCLVCGEEQIERFGIIVCTCVTIWRLSQDPTFAAALG